MAITLEKDTTPPVTVPPVSNSSPLHTDQWNKMVDILSGTDTDKIVNTALDTAVYVAITGLGVQTQALNMGTQLINAVVDPVGPQDAATKNYVDTQGFASLPVVDTTSIVEGSVDATKELRFEVDGNATGVIGVLATTFSTVKTITFPDATDILMGKATTDVMTNKEYDMTGAGNLLRHENAYTIIFSETGGQFQRRNTITGVVTTFASAAFGTELQAAHDELNEGGSIFLKIPETVSLYTIGANGVTITKSGVSIIGEAGAFDQGVQGSGVRLWSNTVGVDFLTVGDGTATGTAESFRLENVAFNSTGVATQRAIVFKGAERPYLDNVFITGPGGAGFTVGLDFIASGTGGILSRAGYFGRVQIQGCTEAGLKMSSGGVLTQGTTGMEFVFLTIAAMQPASFAVKFDDNCDDNYFHVLKTTTNSLNTTGIRCGPGAAGIQFSLNYIDVLHMSSGGDAASTYIEVFDDTNLPGEPPLIINKFLAEGVSSALIYDINTGARRPEVFWRSTPNIVHGGETYKQVISGITETPIDTNEPTFGSFRLGKRTTADTSVVDADVGDSEGMISYNQFDTAIYMRDASSWSKVAGPTTAFTDINNNFSSPQRIRASSGIPTLQLQLNLESAGGSAGSVFFQALNTTPVFFTFASIGSLSNSITAGSETGRLNLTVADGTGTTPVVLQLHGPSNEVRILNSADLDIGAGNIQNAANVTLNAGGKLSVDSDATEAGFFDLGHTADPSSATKGDMYMNTTANEYRFFDGTIWHSMKAAAAGGLALTTKGDLHTFTTVDFALPIGADTFVLTADAAEASGMKWASAGAASLPVVDTTSIAEGSADATKEVRFEVDGNTTGIIGVIATTFSTAKTVTIPDVTSDFAMEAFANVFTENQTIATTGSNTVLFMNRTDILLGAIMEIQFRNNSIIFGELSNVTRNIGVGTERGQMNLSVMENGVLTQYIQLRGQAGDLSVEIMRNLRINDITDETKTVTFDVAGAATATTTTLDFNGTVNQTVTFPDATGTVLLDTSTIDFEDTTVLNAYQGPDIVVYEETNDNFRRRNMRTGVTVSDTNFQTIMQGALDDATVGQWVHLKSKGDAGGQYIVTGLTVSNDRVRLTGDSAGNISGAGATTIRTNTNDATVLTIDGDDFFMDNITIQNGLATGVTGIKIEKAKARWGRIYIRAASVDFKVGMLIEPVGLNPVSAAGGDFLQIQGCVDGLVINGTPSGGTASIFTAGKVTVGGYSGIALHLKAVTDGGHIQSFQCFSGGTTSEAIRSGDPGNLSEFTYGFHIGTATLGSGGASSFHIRVFEDIQKVTSYSLIIDKMHVEGNTGKSVVVLEDANSRMAYYMNSQEDSGGSVNNPRGIFTDGMQFVGFSDEIRDFVNNEDGVGSFMLPFRTTADDTILDTDFANIESAFGYNQNDTRLYYRNATTTWLGVVSEGIENTYGAFLQDFALATMRIPHSAAPTIAVNGDIGIDTTITDFTTPLIRYFGTESMAVIAVPDAELTTPSDGQAVTYNATTDEFELRAPSGSGDMILAAIQTVTGAKTFGTIGGAVGKFILAGSTSGSSILDAAAVAGSTTLTLPGVTDTLAVIGINNLFTANQAITRDGAVASWNLTSYFTATNGVQWIGRSARGSEGTPLAVANNDFLSNFTGQGHDGTAFSGNVVQVVLAANEIFTGTNQGTKILFRTTPNASTTIEETMVITATDLTFIDGHKTTFNPDASNAGINVGQQAAPAPTTQVNGDIWYDSTADTLFGRIGGADVNLGQSGSEVFTWTANHDANGFALEAPLFADATTPTKLLAFDLTGITAAITGTLAFGFTTAKIITFPDLTGNVLLDTSTIDTEDTTIANLLDSADITIYNDTGTNFVRRDNLTGVITDDGTTLQVLQAAVDALPNGGKIYLKASANNYSMGAGLNLPNDGLTIEGEAYGVSASPFRGVKFFTSTASAVVFNVTAVVRLSNFEIQMGSNVQTITGIRIAGAGNQGELRNIYIHGTSGTANHAKIGLELEGTGTTNVGRWMIENIKVENCLDCYRFDGISGAAATTNTLINCTATSYSGSAIKFDQFCDGNHFYYFKASAPTQNNQILMRFGEGALGSQFSNQFFHGLEMAFPTRTGTVVFEVWENDTQTNHPPCTIIGGHLQGFAGTTIFNLQTNANRPDAYFASQNVGDWRGHHMEALEIGGIRENIIEIAEGTFGTFKMPLRTTADDTVVDADFGDVNGLLGMNDNNDSPYVRGSAVWQKMLTESNTATLTNKTIDGDLNTLIDINETQMNVSVGVATTVLTSNGVGVAPTYQTAAGGEFTGAWTANHNNTGSAFALEDAKFADPTDDTKTIQLNLAGMTTAIELTISTSQTTAQTLTIPNISAARSFVVTGETSQIVIGTEVTGASTALTDTGDIAYLNTANVFLSGNRQEFTSDGTNAGLRIVEFATAPTGILQGDLYILTGSSNIIRYRGTSANQALVSEGIAQNVNNKTFAGTTVINAALTWNEFRQTFNPNATIAGINVGAHTAEPSTPVAGDIFFDSTANQIKGYDGTSFLNLGGAGSSLPVVDTTSIAEGSADATKEVRFEVDGNATGIIGVLATVFQTANTITFPDVTDTLVVRGANTFNATQELVRTGAIPSYQFFRDEQLTNTTIGQLLFRSDSDDAGVHNFGEVVVITRGITAGSEGGQLNLSVADNSLSGAMTAYLLVRGQDQELRTTVDLNLQTNDLINTGDVAIGQASPTAGKTVSITIPDDTVNEGLLIQNTDGSIALVNGSALVGDFQPLIETEAAGGNTIVSLWIANIPVADDSGTVPVLRLDGRQTDNTAVVTRPILDITNNTVKLWEISAGGDVDGQGNTWTNFIADTVTLNADNSTITNIGSSEVKSELITGLTQVAPLGADELMITDASDAGNLKRVLVSALPGGETFTWTADHDAANNDLLNFASLQQNGIESTVGALRLVNSTGLLGWRNVANDADHTFGINAVDDLELTTPTGLQATLVLFRLEDQVAAPCAAIRFDGRNSTPVQHIFGIVKV